MTAPELVLWGERDPYAVPRFGARLAERTGARFVSFPDCSHWWQLMIYLPKERLLIQADAFTPGPPNAPVPAINNPLSVNLADNIARLNLGVDRLLPLHGRIVPLSELHRMIGRGN